MGTAKLYGYHELLNTPQVMDLRQDWVICEKSTVGFFGQIHYHKKWSGGNGFLDRRWEVDIPKCKEENPDTPDHHYRFISLVNALKFVKECAGLFTDHLLFEAVPLVEPKPMTENTLILTIGLPRSGKSTWARETGCPIVNLDSIRLSLHGQRYWGPAEPMVSAHAHVMVSSLFLAGNLTVILDACNHTARRRTGWYCREDTPAQWVTLCHHIDTSEETCHERAIAEGDMKIRPVITRMDQDWDYHPEDEQDWSEPTMKLLAPKNPNTVPRGGYNVTSFQQLYDQQIAYHK